MRIALAKSDAGSTSSQPTLASECPSRQTPRCEDRQYLPGQGLAPLAHIAEATLMREGQAECAVANFVP